MPFREINSKMIEATVRPGARIFSQRGAMLAYQGDVSFTPNVQGGQGGLMSMIGRRAAGEATPLMTVEGSGTVLFGHGGHHIQVIGLSGDTLFVEADRLLAFEGTLQQGTMFMGSEGGVMGMVRGQVSGQGLFTTTLKGHGAVAVMAHGGVIEVPITPQRPVHVDPRRTWRTTARSATNCPRRSAGATWWAAAPARRSSWSCRGPARSTSKPRRRSCEPERLRPRGRPGRLRPDDAAER
ncbi:hypothetical protein SALBM135S_07156 [Streptomyces alboniger]